MSLANCFVVLERERGRVEARRNSSNSTVCTYALLTRLADGNTIRRDVSLCPPNHP